MKSTLITLVILSVLITLVIPAASLVLANGAHGEPLPKSVGVLPTSFLWRLDLLLEQIGDFFAFSAEAKIKRAFEHAEERLLEARAVIERKRADAALKALALRDKKIQEATDRIAKAKEQGKDVAALAERVAEATLKHQEVLAEVLEKVPEQARSGIQRAIEVSKRGHERAVEVVSENVRKRLQRRAEQVAEEVRKHLEELGISIPPPVPVEVPSVIPETPPAEKEQLTTPPAVEEQPPPESSSVPPPPAVKEFKITARQFDFGREQFQVKLGDTVRLIVTSIDVTHGIALNEFGINRVLRPNETEIIEFTADKKGTFRIFCSVPCGVGHFDMDAQLIVE